MFWFGFLLGILTGVYLLFILFGLVVSRDEDHEEDEK